jgi:SAM-dependent methyltransferase
MRVEIGAGVSFFKELYPEIVSTDIKKAKGLDRVLDAQNMDLENESVRAFYGLNCFHHFPEPNKFFDELNRVLVPGGGCILIEPYHGFVASRFYKKLFDTETFDKNQKEWINSKSEIMLGANQALSYVVFKRDLQKFNLQYPDLDVVLQRPLNNYLQYLVCGGLNFRSLVPPFLSPLVRLAEIIISPLNRIFALHHIIIVQKKDKKF